MPLRGGMWAVLFTDLVGSTEQRARVGDVVADDIRRSHDALVNRSCARHGGVFVKSTGDGAMCAFESAADAVAAAVSIQQGVDRQNQRAEHAMSLRIGVSVGDLAAEGDDLFGLAVNEAARLSALAEGGEILVSDALRMLAAPRLSNELVGRGERMLKGLPAPVQVWSVEWVSLPDVQLPPFPSLLQPIGGKAFAGRAVELAKLRESAQRCARGGCEVVLLCGEPGIGKTRLVGEFALGERSAGALVMYGRCDDGLAVAFQPFAEALEWYATHIDWPESGDQPADLARLSSSFRRLFGGSLEALTTDPATEQWRLFAAYASWLVEVSQHQPVLLIIDDVHWATQPTLLLFRYLVMATADARVQIVATYRDTDLDRQHPLAATLADFRRLPSVERIVLRGLTPEHVLTVLGSVRSDRGGDDSRDLATAIHAETEGNPFFVGEVIHHLAESGVLERDESGWTTMMEVSEIGIPDGVKEVVGQRLDRLGTNASLVLRGAAVAGRDFTVGESAAASGLAESDVVTALELACDAQLVLETAADRFRFSHAIVHGTLLDEISTTRRLRMHRAIAEHLEGADPTNLVALARHWCAASVAGDTDKAVSFSMAAAAGALQRSAYEDAVSLLRDPLEIVAPDDERTRLRLLLELGRAEVATGDPMRYRPTFKHAAELADRLDDSHAHAVAVLGYVGRHETLTGLDAFARDGVERALAELDRDAEPGLVCELLGALASGIANREPTRAEAVSTEALDLARRQRNPHMIAAAGRARLRCWWDPLATENRLALAHEVREAATSARLPEVVAQSWQWDAVIQLERADLNQVQHALDNIDRINARLDLRYFRWAATARRAAVALSSGALADAERLINESAQLEVHDFSILLGQIGVLRWLQGRAAELLDAIPEYDPLTGTPTDLILLLAQRALFAAEAGNVTAARASLNEFVDRWNGGDVPPGPPEVVLIMTARATRLVGPGPWLDPIAAALEPLSGRFGVVNPGVSSLGAIDGARGALALAGGHRETAIELLLSAVEQNRVAGLRPFTATAQADLAEALAATDPDAARTHAIDARRLAVEIGMAHIVAQVDSLLESLPTAAGHRDDT